MSTKIAAVGDIHAGSTVAVCPPRIHLDDGGSYEASPAQLWLWERWTRYWERFATVVADVSILVLNGDLVDGDHHETPQIMSRNPNAQAEALRQILDVPLACAPDHIFIVRGTECHVGSSGAAEETLATNLREAGYPVEPDPDSESHSWWHLVAELDGVKVDVAHHGRMGRLPWTRAGIVQRDAAKIFYEYHKRGERHPDLAIRSHNHRAADSYDAHPVRLVALGAWQLATAHIHRIDPDTLADIGGAIVVTDGGRYDVEKVYFAPDTRGKVWTRHT